MYHLKEFERRLLIICLLDVQRNVKLFSNGSFTLLLYTDNNEKFNQYTNYFVKLELEKNSL